MKKLLMAGSLLAVGAFLALGTAAGDAPGRTVGADEAAALRGGACAHVYARNCGGGSCGTSSGFCLDPSGLYATPTGDTCNDVCHIYKGRVSCGS